MARWWRSCRAAVWGPTRRVRGERGTLALELSILAPVIVVLLWMMISAGRVAEAASKVEGAARDGARAASINHAGQPAAAADTAVRNSLQANGVTCVGAPEVVLSVKNGSMPLDPSDVAQVTVTCRVALLLGGANAPVTRTGLSVLDTYRGTT
jgi:Flp pilus assembly protein TadG